MMGSAGTSLEAPREVEAIFHEVFRDPDRVGVSRVGFNTV